MPVSAYQTFWCADDWLINYREIRLEHLALKGSLSGMKDAVSRLDNLLMGLYFIVCGLLVAVALEAQLVTLITGIGTLILGTHKKIWMLILVWVPLCLSWLIGASLQEVLSSIILLFIKHPFDVGDRITLLTAREDPQIYNVKEIQLLTTIFLDAQGCRVYVPNPIINSLVSVYV